MKINVTYTAKDLFAYKISKMKAYAMYTSEATFGTNYWYYDPWIMMTDKVFFSFTEEVTGNEILDNPRDYTFNNYWSQKTSTPYWETGGSAQISYGYFPTIDFSTQNPLDIPCVFDKCYFEVTCEPKWEDNANTLIIETTQNTGQTLDFQLFTIPDAVYCVWENAQTSAKDTAINAGNTGYTFYGNDVVKTINMNTAQKWYIRGDLSKIIGLKITGDGGFKVTGLEYCKNLELIDCVHSGTDYGVSTLSSRTLDVIPNSVKYLFLDWVQVTRCDATDIERFLVTGHSNCFSDDIVNYLTADTKYLKYVSADTYADLTFTYKPVRFRRQAWRPKDLRLFNVIDLGDAVDMTNFVESLYMYLEPNPLIINEQPVLRYIYATSSNSEANQIWDDLEWMRNDIQNRPQYVLGEY